MCESKATGSKGLRSKPSLGMNNTCQQWNYWLNFVVQVDHMQCCWRSAAIPTNRPTAEVNATLPNAHQPNFQCKAHILGILFMLVCMFGDGFLSWRTKCFATLSAVPSCSPFCTFSECENKREKETKWNRFRVWIFHSNRNAYRRVWISLVNSTLNVIWFCWWLGAWASILLVVMLLFPFFHCLPAGFRIS